MPAEWATSRKVTGLGTAVWETARAGKQDDIQIARNRNDRAHGNERASRSPHKLLTGVGERLGRTCQLRQRADANNLNQNVREGYDSSRNQQGPRQVPLRITNFSGWNRSHLKSREGIEQQDRKSVV